MGALFPNIFLLCRRSVEVPIHVRVSGLAVSLEVWELKTIEAFFLRDSRQILVSNVVRSFYLIYRHCAPKSD